MDNYSRDRLASEISEEREVMIRLQQVCMYRLASETTNCTEEREARLYTYSR